LTGTHKLIVIDTNVIISAVIFRHSEPRQALLHAFESSDVLSSHPTQQEYREVMAREKFNRYASYDLRMFELERILDQMKIADPVVCDSACRDPKDVKFLELAVGAGASLILSGDVHLLELHPFRGISILTPLEYLAQEHA
jgi:putative PIN family toxin of toxin-antitoxin system